MTDMLLRAADAPRNDTSTDVGAAIEVIGRGGCVVVVDDAGRGDLVMAAELTTPEAIAFFIGRTSGLICVSLPSSRCDELRLPPMVNRWTESDTMAFTVSVDHRDRCTTGISAADRSTTIAALVDPATEPDELARPGHVFPVRSHDDGVLERAGRAEAAADLARLAGLTAAGVFCQVITEEGGVAEGADIARFARDHGLVTVSIGAVDLYRRAASGLGVRREDNELTTRWGRFRCVTYESVLDGQLVVAFVRGQVRHDSRTSVHRVCVAGEVLGSGGCACGHRLEAAMASLAELEGGVAVYLPSIERRVPGASGRPRCDARRISGEQDDLAVARQVLIDLAKSGGEVFDPLMQEVPACFGSG